MNSADGYSQNVSISLGEQYSLDELVFWSIERKNNQEIPVIMISTY